jgi:hypothetical protein
MTTHDSRPGVSLTMFLSGEKTPDDAAAALGRTLNDHGVAQTASRTMRHLTTGAREAVDQEVAKVATGLMSIDLGDALVAGWQRYSALKESARRTLEMPGSEEVTSLASHRVTSTYRPRVDLVYDGVRVNSFEFELTAVFDVSGVAAVMAAGRLVALRGGQCQLAVRLRLEGLQLVERQRSMAPGLLVPLRHPVVFASAAAAAAADVPEQRTAPAVQPVSEAAGHPVPRRVRRAPSASTPRT